MRLERLRCFEKHVLADGQIQGLISGASICWSFENKWFENPAEKKELTGSCDDLVIASVLEAPWKKQRSDIVYFPIPKHNAVLVCKFQSPPQKRTRDKFEQYIDRCLVASSNEYNAKYDNLTGLLNSQGYEDLLRSQAQALSESTQTQGTTVESVQRPDSLILVSLDIDHFKQINDSYGHLYGDWVLKALARRLDETTDRINDQFGERLNAQCARPHGEEFFLVVSGAINPDDELRLGELVRTAVEASVLPSEDELRWLEGEHGKPEFSIPGTSKRLVTVSVGVAAIGAEAVAESQGESIERLKSRADVALYRAKASGRNCVCRFGDILGLFGRVLEHDQTTDVVAIDIGKNVGVTDGQEFLVRPPKYSGKTAFVYKDGRTEKNLGLYPNLSIGRLVAFNVQREISFCEIYDRKVQGLVPTGSILEAIPAGTIKHHLSKGYSRMEGDSSVYGYTDLQKTINSYVQQEEEPTAMVFAISNVDQVLTNHGVALVNRILAWLYSKLDTVMRQAAGRVGQIDGMRIAIVAEKGKINPIDIFADLRRQALIEFGDMAKVEVGIFDKNICLNSLPARNEIDLNLARALDCAQFAVSSDVNPQSGLEYFTKGTAVSLLAKHRKQRDLQKAKRDYEEFSSIGIMDSAVENQLALCAFEARDYGGAIEAAERATHLDPQDVFCRCNLGLALYANGNLGEAAREFEQVIKGTEKKDGGAWPAPYRATIAAALYEANENGLHTVKADTLKLAFENVSDAPYAYWMRVPRLTFNRWVESMRSL